MHADNLRVQLDRSTAPRGFTLIEVMVAVALSVVVLAGARLLMENIASETDRVVRTSELAEEEASAEGILRALVGQIEVGVEDETFRGDEESAQFTTWCQSPRGWLERCRITLDVRSVAGAWILFTSLPSGDRVVLRRAKERLGLRYLVDARAGGTWFVEWGEGLLAPAAIGVIADSDTMIVRIGERS